MGWHAAATHNPMQQPWLQQPPKTRTGDLKFELHLLRVAQRVQVGVNGIAHWPRAAAQDEHICSRRRQVCLDHVSADETRAALPAGRRLVQDVVNLPGDEKSGQRVSVCYFSRRKYIPTLPQARTRAIGLQMHSTWSSQRHNGEVIFTERGQWPPAP